MRLLQMLALSLATGPALAQVQNGDVLVGTFSNTLGESALIRYDADGALRGSTTLGTGGAWIGVGATPSGEIVLGRAIEPGVNFFDASTLAEVASWDTGGAPLADVEVFVDGVLAIVDQGGLVRLFAQDGTPQGTISDPMLGYPIGLGRSVDGDLWVTDFVGNDVMLFERSGAMLASFDPGFFSSDVAPAPDGSLWLIDTDTGDVHRFSSAGAPLESFPTVAAPYIAMGLGLAADGSLWVTSGATLELYHYDPNGALIGTFPIPAITGPAFLRVVEGNQTGGEIFCAGDGSGSACPCGNPGAAESGCANGSFSEGCGLSATGNASVSADSLVLSVVRSTPDQPGLFFQGDSALAGGDGVPFGDGLRCTGDNVVRLEILFAGDSSAATTVPIAAAAGLSPGDLKRYQWWYRDPAGSPCGAGFNLSNGLELTWAP